MVVKDPVCLMDVDTDTAMFRSEYKGQTYYFCSPGCKADFDNNPQKYMEAAKTQGSVPRTGTDSGEDQ